MRNKILLEFWQKSLDSQIGLVYIKSVMKNKIAPSKGETDMNKFVIASKHSAFGKLYLGRNQPVKSKAAAISFGSDESAKERIAFWQGLIAKEDLDPKFFGNMYVEQK